MIVQFKRGLSFLAIGIATLVLERIFGFLEPLLINSVTEFLNVQPFIIVNIIALSIMGIGIILILDEKYGWFKKHTNQKTEQITLADKRKHTQELNEKIFKRLTTLTIREDTRSNYNLYISKNEQYDNSQHSNIIYTKEDRTVIPLDKLHQPYYDWALRHLEDKEYADKILNPFKNLQKLIEEYNEIENKYRETLEEKIDNTIRESFSDCTIFPKTIRSKIESEIWVENPEHRFTDLIKDRISQHDAIMSRGYPMGHPYIICKTITDEQLEQFKELLKSITDSDECLSTNQEQMKILKEINIILKELKNNFQLLSNELEASGSIIQGRCKLSF